MSSRGSDNDSSDFGGGFYPATNRMTYVALPVQTLNMVIRSRRIKLNIQQNLADINQTRLHCEVAGTGDPVVMIHGLGSDLRVWDLSFQPLLNAIVRSVTTFTVMGNRRLPRVSQAMLTQ
jgi:hypothetical protein